jgi:hypothetical protein
VKVSVTQFHRRGRHRARIETAAEQNANRNIRCDQPKLNGIEKEVREFALDARLGPVLDSFVRQDVGSPEPDEPRAVLLVELQRVARRELPDPFPHATGPGRIYVR